MGKRGELPPRQALLEQMWALAGAKVNDAVKLAYLQEEQMERIGRLNLDALTEFKRGGNGSVELKFSDRMKALERLLELTGEGAEERLNAFLSAIEPEREE